MNPAEIRARFQDLTVWTRGDERAPHKPLLLLYALGRYARGDDRLISYNELEDDVERLLFEFGPPRRSYHPEYPFARLRNDGVWEVLGASVRESGDFRVTELRDNDARGGMLEAMYEAVTSDPALLRDLTHLLLDAHFPDTLHADICDAVGLGELSLVRRRARDPEFRVNVLTAYERRCAVCDFHVRLGDVLVGIEAAHIQWHQARGPSVVQNGLALCTLHHKLLDRGAYTLSSERTVTVSDRATGGAGLDDWLLRFHGVPLRPPVNADYLPDEDYLAWHRREVFRGPGRPPSPAPGA